MNNTADHTIVNDLVTYRVNIYFTNGKSLGFVNIYMDDEKTTDETTLQIKKLIQTYEDRQKQLQEVVKIHSGKAEYYIDTYQISLIEIIKNIKKSSK